MPCSHCGALLEASDTVCPQCGTPRSAAPELPQTILVVEGPNGRMEHPVASGPITIGRKSDNSVVLPDETISRHHAEIDCESGGFVIADLGSGNGTLLNDTRLAQQQPEPFRPGDHVQIGPYTLSLHTASMPIIEPPSQNDGPPTEMWTPGKSLPPFASGASSGNGHKNLGRVIDLAERTVWRIGRSKESHILIDHPQVSRNHVVIEREGEGYKLTDPGSTNGTFVNGQRIEGPRSLQEGDSIQIASYRLVLRGTQLHLADEHGNISVDALHLGKTVGKGYSILTDVSLAIQPCEFVAIVGGSGAGKTTLLDALNGFRPATRGAVLYNGVNLYHNFDAYRNVIGYVPQDDIIHRELTVYGALNYAAQLRLPRDTTGEERKARINEVMKDLALDKRGDTPIANLSGGQRKRVSIGVELLNKPSLIFLDEPTSGLDPSTETKMMRLLRELADQGHTVLLVTHVTANVSLCDKVAIMAPGGRLAFYGRPKEALEYFRVRDFVDIYDQLDQSKAEDLQSQYVQSPQYQQYVAQPLSVHSEAAAEAAHSGHVSPGYKRISALRQFTILSRRNLEILFRDRASLVLMLLIAPLLGLLDVVTWKGNLFDVQGGNSVQAITVLFITALDCVLVGALASMREIVKETEVYRRERMVGLGIVPYLGSKVWLGVVLALYQALMFVAFKVLVIPSLPHDPVSLAQMYVTLTLTTLAGMLMGLFISAISPNQNVAPLLTILLLVPQIIFGGGILPVSALPNGAVVSQAMITKWGFDSLVTISQIGRDVANDACWNVANARADPSFSAPVGQDDSKTLADWQAGLTDAYKKQNCACLGSSIFSSCRFPGLTNNYTAADKQAVDSSEPVQPNKPGAAPAQPAAPPAAPADPGAQPKCDQTDPNCLLQTKDWQTKVTQWQGDLAAWSKQMGDWKNQMQSWQGQMDTYKQDTTNYQDAISAWQTAYKDWKEKRDKAIGGAEALVRKTFDDYGAFFQMNLVQAWGALGVIMAAFFGLIFAAQKYKDLAAR